MKVRRLIFGIGAALGVALASSAQAEIIITTNMGGADAEVREHQVVSDADTGAVSGVNRGADMELGTTIRDTVTTSADGLTITEPFVSGAGGTGDRSSVIYLKFDIGSLPPANDAFWNDKEVSFKAHIRNNNLPASRLLSNPPTVASDDTANFVRHKFKVRALDPNGVYVENDANAANRTDDNTNPYVNNEYKYNWSESAITYANAPGMDLFCADGGACNINETVGLIDDDFNSDAVMLGEWQWPVPTPANHLPVGLPVEFNDPSLKQLVLDAKAAGRTTVTLIVAHGMDGTSHQPLVGRVGTTPASMIGHNYLMVPKEHLTLQNDTNYDPDSNSADNYHAVNNPLGDQEVGSPYSCTFDLNTRPQCTGQGDNSGGAFSPALIIRVPEPASAALLAMGSLLAWASFRRRAR